MSERPFHHGNLRAVLLDEAEAVLRERGTEALSLRELARKAGVSHGAPRSHFIDRNALLDALAERGYLRLVDDLREATSRASGGYAATLRAAAAAYVKYATSNPALLDLMFAAKVDRSSAAVRSAAERLFTTMTDILGEGVEAGACEPHEVGRLALLLSSTMQGIAALVTSRRITGPQSDAVIDDAIAVFLAGISAGALTPGSETASSPHG
ncbi:TetR/AcrR family transcriptional regulator [Amycolatopsis ultiminotia]|uniref:TetR/AcrR family transcriptional regulator n=1 Tax=Amycolatopsis ultiminotia TaxID=543629 RepID=UPI0031E6E7CB